MHHVPPDNHPRPQIRRPVIVLCGEWAFAFDDDDRGLIDAWAEDATPFDRTIVVPFPPESAASGIGDTGYHRVVWYRRTFVAPVGAERVVLHFGAVDYRARVWVNGRLVATHEGGNTPFSAEITSRLRDGEEQVLVVRAEDDPEDLSQPRGKQYWEKDPAFIWYHRTTGIWQPVWLETPGAIAIETVRWTPDLERFGVALTVRLDAKVPPDARLIVRLVSDKGDTVLADDSYAIAGSEVRRDILLGAGDHYRRRNSLTWAPEHPRLISATIELHGAGGILIDRVESYFGLRSVEVRDGRFMLNGVPTFLRLVLAQNFWPETHLAAPSGDALREEVRLAKALGFNGVRIHQKIEDPRFLHWCDRLGMMVWAEAANAYVYDDRAADALTREWLAAVQRDYNHPSIVTWVPMNESWGVPDLDRSAPQRSFVAALYHLTRALDATRPVIGNDGWQHAVGDIFGIHDYAPKGETLLERYGSRAAIARTMAEVRPHHAPLLSQGRTLTEEPVVISEFGGLSFTPQGGDKWFGYGKFEDQVALLAAYEDLVDALLQSTALAGFCYTQLTDTLQETNGLLSADRTPKLDPAAIRAINTRPSRAIPNELLEAVFKADLERRRRETGVEDLEN